MEHSIITTSNSIDLTISGKFTFSDNRAFDKILEDITNKLYKEIVINLDEVSYIDSAALGILLLIRDKCIKSSTNLLIKNPRGQVKQMFDISRFADLFEIEM